MSQHETATPQPKMAIDVDRSPAPPWAGVKFICANEKCRAEYRLEAADECTPCGVIVASMPACFVTPQCWDCGLATIITIAAPSDVTIQPFNDSTRSSATP